MNEAKKRERLAALFGMEAPKPPTKEEKIAADSVSREAEAVIAYFEDPRKFAEKMCKWCERIFAVNRGNIAFCSDECRGKHLNEVVKLEWSPNQRTPDERWAMNTGGREPLIVPPTALALLHQTQDQENATDAVAG